MNLIIKDDGTIFCPECNEAVGATNSFIWETYQDVIEKNHTHEKKEGEQNGQD